jgi:dolichol-phosphate mannosyltransferase
LNGASIIEIPVNHRSRLHGKSNYGLERVFKVILDLILVKFLEKYYQKPIYIFGAVAFIALFFSASSGVYALYLKYFQSIDFIMTPLPMITIISFLTFLMCLLLGLLAEMSSRTWHEPQGKNLYQIKKIVRGRSN